MSQSNLTLEDNEKSNINNKMNPKGRFYGYQNVNVPQKDETTFNPIRIIRTQDIEKDQKADEFSILRNSQTKYKENNINS